MDNFEPKIDSQLTVKSVEDLRLWSANLFARIKNEFFFRERYLRHLAGTFSTTTTSGITILDTFVVPANNFIKSNTSLKLIVDGISSSTIASKQITVKAGGVTVGQVTGLGGLNDTFRLSLEIVAVSQNSQISFALAYVTGADVVVRMVNSNIDFTSDVTFSVLATTTVATPAELTLKHLSLQYSGKLINQ